MENWNYCLLPNHSGQPLHKYARNIIYRLFVSPVLEFELLSVMALITDSHFEQLITLLGFLCLVVIYQLFHDLRYVLSKYKITENGITLLLSGLTGARQYTALWKDVYAAVEYSGFEDTPLFYFFLTKPRRRRQFDVHNVYHDMPSKRMIVIKKTPEFTEQLSKYLPSEIAVQTRKKDDFWYLGQEL